MLTIGLVTFESIIERYRSVFGHFAALISTTLLSTVLLLVGTGFAQSLPAGGSVAASDATISGAGGSLLINQRTMHDGLGSSLVGALRMVERGKLKEAGLTQVLPGCIDDLKLTIDSMEPVETDLLLLLGAWRFRLQPRPESSGIKLRWDVQDVPPLAWLDHYHALHILRIPQEAFTNIIKHADATCR